MLNVFTAAIILFHIQRSPTSPVRAVSVPLYTMNDGRTIPAVCFGTWLGYTEGVGYTKSNGTDMLLAVKAAIDIGVRHFDLSLKYSQSVMTQLKTAIANKIDEGAVRREDIFLTMKLPLTEAREERMLTFLKPEDNNQTLNYDLLLMYWPFAIKEVYPQESQPPVLGSILKPIVDVFMSIWRHIANRKNEKVQVEDRSHDYVTTWRSMIKARSLNLTKSIGLSNVNISQIQRLILETGVKPAVVQIEVNLNGNNAEMIEYCKRMNILVMGYSVMGSVFSKSRSHLSPPPKSDDPTLANIAFKHNKTVGQIILRYVVELGVIPIFKSFNTKHIKENIDIFGFKLDQHDIKTLKRFDFGYQLYPQKRNSIKKYYPYVNYIKQENNIINKLKQWTDDYYNKNVQFPS